MTRKKAKKLLIVQVGEEKFISVKYVIKLLDKIGKQAGKIKEELINQTKEKENDFPQKKESNFPTGTPENN